MKQITKNQIKLISSLKLAKNRKKEKLFLAEGVKTISELLSSQLTLHSFYYTEPTELKVPENLSFQVSTATMKKMSNLKTPPNLLAAFEVPKSKAISEIQGPVVLLEDIRDPGNLGTIIRTCDWFGVKNVICSSESVDVFNPKVVQSTMGSIARIHVLYYPLNEVIKYLKDRDYQILRADLKGKNLSQFKAKTNWSILFGNESNGISEDLRNEITESLTIPKKGEAESLNLSISVGVMLSQLTQSY